MSVYEVSVGNVRVNSSLGTISSVVLFVLYWRESTYAGSFLFWTTVPTYPIYCGLASLGMIDPRPTTVPLVISAVLWVGALVYTWILRRKYAAYLEGVSPVIRPGGTT
jgi:hypothetical protein